MASCHPDARLTQEIVARTMRIIDSNVNVMDAHGRIIGSGDPARIGEMHKGALLALSSCAAFGNGESTLYSSQDAGISA